MSEHEGKTVFITGGTSGINLGIAKGFAREGAKVAVIGRDPERAANAEAEIKAECTGDGNAMGFSCDVRDYDAVEAALKKVSETYGSIDVLVAGAAGNFYAPLLGMSPNAFRTVVDIDLFGTFSAFRAGCIVRLSVSPSEEGESGGQIFAVNSNCTLDSGNISGCTCANCSF